MLWCGTLWNGAYTERRRGYETIKNISLYFIIVPRLPDYQQRNTKATVRHSRNIPQVYCTFIVRIRTRDRSEELIVGGCRCSNEEQV